MRKGGGGSNGGRCALPICTTCDVCLVGVKLVFDNHLQDIYTLQPRFYSGRL